MYIITIYIIRLLKLSSCVKNFLREPESEFTQVVGIKSIALGLEPVMFHTTHARRLL